MCSLTLSRLTKAVWWSSAILYGVSFFVAWALGPLLEWGAR